MFLSPGSGAHFCRPGVTQKSPHRPDGSKAPSTPARRDHHALGLEGITAKLQGSFCALMIKISGQSLVSLQLARGSRAGGLFPLSWKLINKHRRVCLPGPQLCSVSGSSGPESEVPSQTPTATQSRVPLGSPALAKCLLRNSRIHHEKSSLGLQERWGWHRPADRPARPPRTQPAAEPEEAKMQGALSSRLPMPTLSDTRIHTGSAVKRVGEGTWATGPTGPHCLPQAAPKAARISTLLDRKGVLHHEVGCLSGGKSRTSGGSNYASCAVELWGESLGKMEGENQTGRAPRKINLGTPGSLTG